MQYIVPMLLIVFGSISTIRPMTMIKMDHFIFKKRMDDLESRKIVTRITGIIALIIGILLFIFKEASK